MPQTRQQRRKKQQRSHYLRSVRGRKRRYRARNRKTMSKIIPKSARRGNKLVTVNQVNRLIKANLEPKFLKNAYGCTFNTDTIQGYTFNYLQASGTPYITSAPTQYMYMSPGISADAQKYTESTVLKAKYR